ncbi:Serine protease inhibitor Kazal-type 5 [Mactra antiquata]
MGFIVLLALFGILGTSIALPTTVAPSCGCAVVLEPVCGDDGITYANNCEMTCVGVQLASQGPCASNGAVTDSPCLCTYQYDPVCGDNGITYINACLLNCAGVHMAQRGECVVNVP